jgi:hypothetical protein
MIKSVKLFPKQYETYKLLSGNEAKFVLYGGGANGGKSWLGCFWIASMCLAYPGTKYFIGRQELKRLRDTTFITFKKVSKMYNIGDLWEYRAQDHYIEFKNGSRIDLLDLKFLPRDPLFERYGSAEYTSGWIEEGGEVHFGAFDVLKSRINRHLNQQFGIIGKMLITCNPKKNWMYKYFYKPSKYNTLKPGYVFIQSLIDDNIYRESGSIEMLEMVENESLLQRLRYGNWEYEDEPDQLIKFIWLEKNNKTEKGKQYLGVDVARYGDDFSTIAHLKGNKLESLKEFKGLDTVEFADIVKISINDNNIDASNVGVDTVGLGAGVFDNLKRDKLNCYEVISGSKPSLTYKGYSFNNLRSMMWWIARDLIKEGKLDLRNIEDKLSEDLTAPKYEIAANKLIKVESKKEIKKRIGRSTDYGDAFVYAIWMRYLRENTRKVSYSVMESRTW